MEEQLKKDVEIVLHKLQNTPMGKRIAKKQIVDLLKARGSLKFKGCLKKVFIFLRDIHSYLSIPF